jgi:LPS-assembly protein
MNALIAVLLLLGQVQGQVPLPKTDEPVRYRGDKGTSSADGNQLSLEGAAELRTERARVQADRITFDQRTQIITASGHCYAVSGLSGATGDGLTLDLTGNVLQLQNGHFFEKANVAPGALLETTTPEQLMAVGKTTLAGRAERIERLGPGHLKINGIDFTPCDCDPLKPHWSIKATQADVHVGDRAWLLLPVVYIYGVPVLPLPVLDLPLKPQKTGLLVTTPSHSAQNGWQVAQPVYFAMAPNWDLTVTPGYTFGGGQSTESPSNGQPATGLNGPVFGIRGPSLDTEARWTHSRNSRGDLELLLFDDLRPIRDPRNLRFYPDVNGPFIISNGTELSTNILTERRNFRGSLNGFVAQALGGPWSARFDVNLVSDSAIVKDTVTDVTQQANQYLRTSAIVTRRTDDTFFDIEATAQQDTFWGGFSIFENDTWPYPTNGDPHRDNSPSGNTRYPYGGANTGQWFRGPATLQKLPSVHLSLPERLLGEHWSWSFTADATRMAPFNGHSGDEGTDGLYQLDTPPLVDPGNPQNDLFSQGNRVFDRGEREARSRLDLVPRIAGSFGIGDWLRIRPSAWVRQDFYVGEVTGNTHQRGYVVGDLLVSSEVSRNFANGLRHAIQPSLQYREIPGQWGAVPGNTPTGTNQPVENRFYDEIDGAIFEAPLHQGVARLVQTLSRRAGLVMQELLRLEVAQELDFRQSNGLADTVVSLRGAYPPFSAGVTFRYDTQRSAPGLWAAFASCQLPWLGVTARFDQLFVPVQFFDRDAAGPRNLSTQAYPITGADLARFGGGGNERMGIDALVGGPVPDNFRTGQRQSAITLEARINLVFGLGLTYAGTLFPDATWTARNADGQLIPAPSSPPGLPTSGSYSLLGQQSFGLSFAPACNCWRLDIIGRLPPPGGQYRPTAGDPSKSELSTFQWRFPDLLFLLTIQNFGTFGAS